MIYCGILQCSWFCMHIFDAETLARIRLLHAIVRASHCSEWFVIYKLRDIFDRCLGLDFNRYVPRFEYRSGREARAVVPTCQLYNASEEILLTRRQSLRYDIRDLISALNNQTSWWCEMIRWKLLLKKYHKKLINTQGVFYFMFLHINIT